MDQCIYWLLTGFSALLLSGAFVWPLYLFWLIFIFLVPLFYGVMRSPSFFSFKQGFWWGIIFWTTHLYGILMLLKERASGDCPLLAGIGLILYCSLHSGVWFLLSNQLLKLFKRISLIVISLCWLITTCSYFYWIRYGILWIWGSFKGYPFGSPLLVLAQYPQTLRYLAFVGQYLFFAIICTLQLCIAYLLLKKRYSYLVALGTALFMCCVLILIPIKNISPLVFLRTIAYVKPPFSKESCLCKSIVINRTIKKIIEKNPLIKTFILPEASLPIGLNKNLLCVELMMEGVDEEDISIIIGSYRSENNSDYTSLYVLKKGRIKEYYDKKVCMPFFEYVPFPWNRFSYFNGLFLKEWNGFEASIIPSSILSLSPDFGVMPYVCSDLFFGTLEASHDSLLAIVNESWFSAKYMQDLMFLYAVFAAVVHQKNILYVGHLRGSWISKNGISIAL